jgi:hypothetical protein
VKRNLFSIAYWLFFALAQTVGMLLPRFVNFHLDPTPLLLSFAILFPGGLLGTLLPEGTNQWIHILFLVVVNAGAWYIFFKFLRIRPKN